MSHTAAKLLPSTHRPQTAPPTANPALHVKLEPEPAIRDSRASPPPLPIPHQQPSKPTAPPPQNPQRIIIIHNGCQREDQRNRGGDAADPVTSPTPCAKKKDSESNSTLTDRLFLVCRKNKATEYHLGLLKGKLARLRAQLLEPAAGAGGGAGTGFDVSKSGGLCLW